MIPDFENEATSIHRLNFRAGKSFYEDRLGVEMKLRLETRNTVRYSLNHIFINYPLKV